MTEAERDHKAMEVLRFNSLKRGWKWRWDGMDLQQVASFPGDTDLYKDPADAILKESTEITGELDGKDLVD